ncbi:hypothetical protein LUZ62_069272 [Rhynchospora pubera]|uniref:Glutaredoxin domain-containing protein n=1 Tax=Rhynchospora pubera TaxID=906938 RepID=A0AAV8CXI6_9POAL|nr:hypothetical protein LUZ62_069272 [Rhynchospora pubera]
MANKSMKGIKSKLLKSWKTFTFGSPKHGKVKHVDTAEREDDLFESTFESTPAPTYGRKLIAPPPITPSPLNPTKPANNNLSLHRQTSSTLEQLLASDDPLRHFEDKCPPNGKNCIVLYTTSLRGIRRTFEDCTKVRNLLENLNVQFHERDISMDLGYREELWDVLGWRATPPRLFIQGKYIGGAEVTLGLNEQEKLLPLLRWVPKKKIGKCNGCGSMGFVVCNECHGSRKIVYDGEGQDTIVERCQACNENGLVTCPICG